MSELLPEGLCDDMIKALLAVGSIRKLVDALVPSALTHQDKHNLTVDFVASLDILRTSTDNVYQYIATVNTE